MRRLMLPLGLAATLFSPLVLPSPSTAAAQPIPGSASHIAPQHDGQPANEVAGPLTLERALALAEVGSFSLSAARLEVQAREGAARQAGARPNPELDVTVEDTRPATRESAVVLSIPLELGGKLEARVAHAELGRDVAAAEHLDARAELRSQVISAFFRVLVAQEATALATSSAALARRGAEATARRVTAGKISPVAETRSRVEQANAELEVTAARAELQSAREALASLWGSSEPVFTEATGDIDELPSRPALDVLLAQADASPALLASRLQLDQRRAAVEVERSKQRPDFALSLGAKRANELGINQAVVGVSVTVPLFDRNEGGVQEAAKRASKAAEEHREARLRLVTALRHAVSRLHTANATAQALRTTVLPAAQQAHDAATQGFEAGKFGLLDVLDTRRTLLEARVRYLSTVGQAYQAAATIDRLVGR